MMSTIDVVVGLSPRDVPESPQPRPVPIAFISVTAPYPWHAMRLGASAAIRILPERKSRKSGRDLRQQCVIACDPEKTMLQYCLRPIPHLLLEKCLSCIQAWEAS